MREIIDSICEQLKLPEIEGERCVHALIENATCRACIEVCPRNAWRLTDDSLGIAVDACDGCGLCAPSCPEGAILFEVPQLVRECNTQKTLLLACERADLEKDKVTVPCVHLFGIGDILKLYGEEIRHIAICTGNCSECDRGKRSDLYLQTKTEAINGLLAARDKPSIACQEIATTDWPQLLQQSRPTVSGPDLNRRQFLRRAIQTAVEEGVRLQRREVTVKTFVPPGQLLPKPEGDAASPIILPYVALPRLDAQRCIGCDACMRICPHEAIQLENDGSQLGYRIEAANCTGCNMCADICDVNALSIEHFQQPTTTFIPLIACRCEVCGAPFHLPIESPQSGSLCRICNRTNHYRNLYQVLD